MFLYSPTEVVVCILKAAHSDLGKLPRFYVTVVFWKRKWGEFGFCLFTQPYGAVSVDLLSLSCLDSYANFSVSVRMDFLSLRDCCQQCDLLDLIETLV